MHKSKALEYAIELIKRKSVTPKVKQIMDYCKQYFHGRGYNCYDLPFGKQNDEIQNLLAIIGEGKPHLCFAGHLDTVPEGECGKWKYQPYSAHIENEKLYGRGAEDMKGNIAAFMAAVELFLANEKKFDGTISFLLTGDEEDKAINGTRKVIEWMEQNNLKPQHAIVGEPSAQKYSGDYIKIGRRGSLNAIITIYGKQGHVAYPEKAVSPINPLMKLTDALTKNSIDKKTPFFQQSNLQITSIDTGNKAFNVIPEKIILKCNVRFNDTQTKEKIENWIQKQCQKIEQEFQPKINIEIQTKSNADVFINNDQEFIYLVKNSISKITQKKVQTSTTGGTSDARFIKNYCPVVEVGMPGQTMHQTDECIKISQLHKITDIYHSILKEYFNHYANI